MVVSCRRFGITIGSISRVQAVTGEAVFLDCLTLEDRTDSCPDTNHNSTLRKTPDESRSLLHQGGSLKLFLDFLNA